MQRILFIGYVWPEPKSSAAGSHILAILAMFRAHNWHITFASPATKTAHMADLAARGIDTAEIALNDSSFDEFITALQPDAVMFDRFMMEEQFGWRVEKHCPDALRILDTEDLFCLRHARHDYFKRHKAMLTAADKSVLFTELAQREIAAILRCDLSLIISEVELQLLTEVFQLDPALLHYCPLMCDPVDDRQQHALADFEQREHFLAIGNFRHPPNWDAVRWLRESIWPLIRQSLPDAQCHIYGAYTPPKATALHNPTQGFHVLGWAEDAFAVMQSARVNLAPLRFGAGLKGKLADAMACGTPSVTTAIGAEGLAGELPWAGAIADTPQAIAEAAVTLYRDATQWYRSQQNGFAIINQRLNRQHHQQQLYSRLLGLQKNLNAQRLNNFTGAMLRHHLHKSTQYMAQWIEAKNRLLK